MGNLGWILSLSFSILGGIFWTIGRWVGVRESVYIFRVFLNSSSIEIPLRFLVDLWALVFAGTVCIISSIVLGFSQFYIEEEKYKLRFIIMLSLFILRILMLIFRGDIVITIVGWDGLGLTSYLLVQYFNSKKSRGAAILTALTNRLGDVGIILFIGMRLIYGRGSPLYLGNLDILIVIIPLLLLRGTTKRAQLPFSSWLPAAMAAPTPVSSLVHSSTLVTAGVYLIFRFSSCLRGRLSSWILICIRRITLLVSRLTAVLESDIKKIIALSTLSQLALMFFILGFGQVKIRFVHLNTHAFFKSVLFIIRGEIIHRFLGWQDMRKCGHIDRAKKGILGVCFVANSRLMGLPFLRGFSSKDLFLELTFYCEWGGWLIFLLYFRLSLTAIYTVRFIKLILICNSHKLVFNMSSPGKVYPFYTVFLAFLRIAGGRCLLWRTMITDSFIFLNLPLKELTVIVIIVSILVGSQNFHFLRDSLEPLKSQFFNLMNLPLIVGTITLIGSRKISFELPHISEGIGLSYVNLGEFSFVRRFSWAGQERRANNFIYLRAAVLVLYTIII